MDRNVQQGELVGGRGRGRGRSKLIKLSTGGDVCDNDNDNLLNGTHSIS